MPQAKRLKLLTFHGKQPRESEQERAAGGGASQEFCYPVATQKLTHAAAMAAKPGPKRYSIPDGSVPGLALRVGTRTKTWVLFYRPRGDGRPGRKVTLGNFPELSIAAARARAGDIRAEIRLGGDPVAELAAQRRAPTFADLARGFIEARDLAPGTARNYTKMLRAYVEPAPLGRLAGGRVRRADLRAALEPVASRAPVQANRLYQFLRAVCRWALRMELLRMNPAEGLERPRRETTRERVLSDDEIKALWAALEGQPVDVAACVRALLLLGQRSTETALMRPQDVDLARALWEIPGSFRKGGRAHAVPLSSAAVAVLRPLVEAGGERVFGLDARNVHRWWSPIREATMDRGAQHFTRHDLRRTCATGCARLGAPGDIVSRLLGHQLGTGLAVTAVYDRYDRLDEIRQALERWGQHVEALSKEKS